MGYCCLLIAWAAQIKEKGLGQNLLFFSSFFDLGFVCFVRGQGRGCSSEKSLKSEMKVHVISCIPRDFLIDEIVYSLRHFLMREPLAVTGGDCASCLRPSGQP